MLAVVSPGGDGDLPMDGIVAAVEHWVADREKTNNRKT